VNDPLTLPEPLDDIDAARAQEYALLAVLLLDPPDADLLARLSRLQGDESPLGAAHQALAAAARTTTPEQAAREFSDLFIGLGRGELLPYGSYYQSGFLHDRPLARLRRDLAALGIERIPERGEPEDHLAILCEVMAGLIDRTLPAPAGAEQAFFHAHVAPWAARFFADLERAETARFYRSVGTLGRLFIDIEVAAFALPSEA
jgi:TorA maturation chaperone TorD